LIQCVHFGIQGTRSHSAFQGDRQIRRVSRKSTGPLMEVVLFPLGRLLATPGALKALERAGETIETLLARHSTGDWGNVCEEDRKENDFSVRNGFRLLSAYKLRDDTKVWIITEADRSATTLLLPDEY